MNQKGNILTGLFFTLFFYWASVKTAPLLYTENGIVTIFCFFMFAASGLGLLARLFGVLFRTLFGGR